MRLSDDVRRRLCQTVRYGWNGMYRTEIDASKELLSQGWIEIRIEQGDEVWYLTEKGVKAFRTRLSLRIVNTGSWRKQ